jgi:UDP-N-acetylglucosamine pyrophosphorylase
LQFEKIIERVKHKIEIKSAADIREIFVSEQHHRYLAVDTENHPFRSDTGRLVFRPAGHGALIDNLNNLDADMIFIKNIDNVIQNHIEDIALYKRRWAAY